MEQGQRRGVEQQGRGGGVFDIVHGRSRMGGVEGENVGERVQIAREVEQQNPAKCEQVDWGAKEERRAQDTEGEEPHRTVAGLSYRMAR